MATAPEKKYRQNQSVAWREIGGEAVLVDSRGGKLLVLNPTGSFLWKEIESPQTLSQLAGALAGAFEVNLETASADVGGFLKTLEERRLVECLP
ncbi:MAG: PqqD family protein [Bdellovibrionota bacterium]